MNGPQLDVVGIVVDDMPKSLAFYRQLGLDMPAEADARPHVEAALAGGMRLAWDTIDEVRTFAPDYEPSAGDGRIGLAFRLDPGGRRCHYNRLTAAGHKGHRAPWDAAWGQRYATVHDPDGNAVDLYAPLPDSGSTS